MLRRIIHTYESHDDARKALLKFFDANEDAKINRRDMSATTAIEYHVFMRFTKLEDWFKLAGSEWHEAKPHKTIERDLSTRLLSKIRLK